MEDRINKLKSDIKTLEDALKLIDKSATGARFTLSNYIGILENELNKLVKENKLKENKLAIDIARTNKIRDLVKDTLYNMCESGSSFNNTTYANVKKIAGLINDFDTTNPLAELISINSVKLEDLLYIDGEMRTVKHINVQTEVFDPNIIIVCNKNIRSSYKSGDVVVRILKGNYDER